LHLLGEAKLFGYLKDKKKAFQTKSKFFSSIKSSAFFIECENYIFERFYPRRIIRNWPHPPAHLRILNLTLNLRRNSQFFIDIHGRVFIIAA
jgi:hypothetical protein